MDSESPEIRAELRERLASWREELLDLSRRNRLLNFRHTKASTLDIREPGYSDLLGRLARGLDFVSLPSQKTDQEEAEAPEPAPRGPRSGILTQRPYQELLDKALKRLDKQSRTTETETGIWTLYLGVGFLRWKGPSEQDHSEAPLLLVPVELSLTDRGRYRLGASDAAESLLNPALGIKLQEFGIDWSSVETVPLDEVGRLMEAVRACVGEQPTWSVEEKVVLAPFTFHKETMYRDLKDNEEAILDHPVIQAVAASPENRIDAPTLEYDLPPLEELDRLQEPESAPLVLDADAYQRRAVAAALDGRSFVIDGPPGTGKSQTIANVIAALIGAGRTVLFVSEKAAALEVVQSRMVDVGVDIAALSLHDGKTKGGAVAKSLDSALHADVRPLPRNLSEERAKVRDLRERLSDHAEAVNEVDLTAELSLNQAMGRVAALSRTLPADTDLGMVEPDPELFPWQARERIVDTARSMTHVWDLLVSPENSRWQGIRQADSGQEALSGALAALNTLSGRLSVLRRLTGGEHPTSAGEARCWVPLLTALTERADVPGHWLLREDFDEGVVSSVTAVVKNLSDLAWLRARTDFDWRAVKELPTSAELVADTFADPVADREPDTSAFDSFTRSRIDEAIHWCVDWERRLTEATGTLDELVRRIGWSEPKDHTEALRITTALARIASGPHPLPKWLSETDPGQVRHLLASFVHHRDRLRESRSRAGKLFHDGVPAQHDIAGLATRSRLWRRAGSLVLERPEVPAYWLATADFASLVHEPALAAWDRRHARTEAMEDLGRLTTLPWHELPAFDPADSTTRVAGMSTDLPVERAREDARFFGGRATRLTEAITVMEEIAGVLACPRPEHPRQAQEFLEAAIGLGAEVRPLPVWLEEEKALEAQGCLDHAEQLVHELVQAREAASDLFAPRILEQEGLSELNERLAGYGGLERLLGSAFREDKRLLTGLTANGTWDKGAPERLPQAIRWQDAHRELTRQTSDCQDRLGAHWRGEHTDFAAVRAALRGAASLRHVLSEGDRSGPRRFLYQDRPLDPRITAGARATLDELAPWEEEARTLLPAAAALHEGSLTEAASWLTSATERLTTDADLVDALAPVLGTSVTTGVARAVRDRALRARHADEELRDHATADESVLGPYRDLLTVRTRQELIADLEWAEHVHGELRSMAEPVLGPDCLDTFGIESLRSRTPAEDPAVRAAEGTLGRAYRRDHALAAGLSHDGVWKPTLFDRMDDAQRWYEDHQSLWGQATVLAKAFGRYWQEEDTDTTALAQALDRADLCHGSLAEEERTALARFLERGDLTDLTEGLAHTLQVLSDWPEAVAALPDVTAQAQGASPGDALEWVRRSRGLLERIREQLRAFHAYTGREVSAGEATREITLAGYRHHAETERELQEQEERALLGPLYRVEEDLVGTCQSALTWARRVRGLIADAVGDSVRQWPEASIPALRSKCSPESLTEAIDGWEGAFGSFAALFDDLERPSITERLTADLKRAEEFLLSLREDITSLERWGIVLSGTEAMRSHGLGPLLDRYVDSQSDPEHWPDTVERAILRAWTDRRLREDDRVLTEPGPVRDNEIRDFRRRDRGLHTWARQEILHRWAERRPSVGSYSPGLAVIRREAEKKRRHMPVRRLMGEITWEAQRLTPCLMMSPLTVSMFLPSNITFDVVIFDEASQVKPADAINCVYRGESLIVAGDQKQLPPTGFFDRVAGGDEEWEEDQQETYESLLDMCKASGRVRDIPLRWHYRSRHEDLIAFSNRKFYDGELITFPGAHLRDDDTGVAFYKVDGVYDRGGARNNRIEAQKVAERVLHHFRTRPQQTLGVVALSREQANAIEDAVDEALERNPHLRGSADGDRLGGFFVKNLETVQGDERDVIILSVGYGPAADGRVRKNFGPINRADGYRRLNVAITRAKYRVEAVSSFSADQLGVGPDDAEGLRRLCEYLRYAEHGPVALEGQPVGGHGVDTEMESPFEDSVLAVLQDWGYEVHPQVGVAGYRIDLGVIDPDRPGRYLLGIECDGAMYHSSKVARDRDRLRDGVLSGLGWRLHRIWGTDWYRDRGRAEQRLREELERALNDARAAGDGSAPTGETAREIEDDEDLPSGLVRIPGERERARTTDLVGRRRPEWLGTYTTFDYRTQDEAYWYEPRSPEARPYIAGLFALITENESPVETEWLYRKTFEALGGERLGSTVRANFDVTLEHLLREGELSREGTTIWWPGGEVEVRSPSLNAMRKVGEVPAVERQEALRLLVRDSARITRKDLLRAMREVFEWGRSGKDITQAFEQDLEALLVKGVLTEENGVIRLLE